MGMSSGHWASCPLSFNESRDTSTTVTISTPHPTYSPEQLALNKRFTFFRVLSTRLEFDKDTPLFQIQTASSDRDFLPTKATQQVTII